MTTTQASPADPLWVITSYYNPAGYRRRLENFRAFRRNLSAPLLVVELTPGGHGELHDADADLVLRLRGDDRIWQKERLLNIGIANLPQHVGYVAWVDADLLFADPEWPAKTRAVLDAHGGMVQPFDIAYHLPPQVDARTVSIADCAGYTPVLTGISFARSFREGLFDSVEAEWGRRLTGIKRENDLYNVRGFAWAARRDVLAAHGLYQGNVIGGSDTIAALAAVGQLERAWVRSPYTPAHAAHARQWAQNARSSGLFAHMADIAQPVYHLWHGDIMNRNYSGRYAILIDNDYDPARDLIIEPGCPLRWADPGSKLAAAVGAYFFSRREDGE